MWAKHFQLPLSNIVFASIGNRELSKENNIQNTFLSDIVIYTHFKKAVSSTININWEIQNI